MDHPIDPTFAPSSDLGAALYDEGAERRLLALALYGAKHVRLEARTALIVVNLTSKERRSIALGHTPDTYEERREHGLVAAAWPHGLDVLDLLDHLLALARRRALFRRALDLSQVATQGSDDEVTSS